MESKNHRGELGNQAKQIIIQMDVSRYQRKRMKLQISLKITTRKRMILQLVSEKFKRKEILSIFSL